MSAPESLPDPNGCRIPTLRQARDAIEPPGVWRHDPAELRALLRLRRLSGAQAASIVGVSPRGFRQWLANRRTRTAREMPYSAWAAVVLLTARVPESVPEFITRSATGVETNA